MNRTKPWKSLSFLLAVTFGTIALPASGLMAQETWTKDSDGKTLTAEFVKLEGVQLTLRKADGKEVVMPLSILDDKSRLKARAIAKDGGASDSASPGSGTAPSKNVTPVEFPSSTSAQEFMDIIVRELKNENPMVVWDALPASKQDQVQEVVKLASTKIEQRTLNLIKKFRAELLSVLGSKKQFILNSRVIPIPPDQKAVLVGSYDSIVGLIEAYVPVEWMDSTYLQKTPIRDVLASYLGRLTRKGKVLEKSLPSDSPFKAMMVSQTAGTATAETISSTEAMVTFAVPGVPGTPMKFILSEGRWLPQDLISNWDQSMTQATRVLEAANPKELHMAVGQGLLFANGLLGTISTAETQQEFDEQVGQLMGMAQMMGGGMGGGMAPPGAGGRGGPGPGPGPGGRGGKLPISPI
jgi:hypothetical protein